MGGLERDGITFESLGEKIDTGSASGKLQLHVFAALAEFERNLIRERTHAGAVGAALKALRASPATTKAKFKFKFIHRHRWADSGV
jgi:DNA invertase Pin-like site-specific DNA recombinase